MAISEDAVNRSQLSYFVLACYALCLVKKGTEVSDVRIASKKIARCLTAKIPIQSCNLPKQALDQLISHLSKIHKIKTMPCIEQRTHAL